MSAECSVTQVPTGESGPSTRLDGLFTPLKGAQRALAERFLGALHASDLVRALLVFGSLPAGRFDPLSDLDVIAVCRDGRARDVLDMISACFNDSQVEFQGETARYPWLGHLASVWFREPYLFALDLGVVEERTLEAFVIFPGAVVLKDAGGRLAARAAATGQDTGASPDGAEELYHLFSLLAKLRKALHRGHLWNAIEYVSQLRRMYIGLLLREAGLPCPPRRPERAIEDRLPAHLLARLAHACPAYDAPSVRAAAVDLAERVLAHPLAPWPRVHATPAARLLSVLRAESASTRPPPAHAS